MWPASRSISARSNFSCRRGKCYSLPVYTLVSVYASLFNTGLGYWLILWWYAQRCKLRHSWTKFNKNFTPTFETLFPHRDIFTSLKFKIPCSLGTVYIWSELFGKGIITYFHAICFFNKILKCSRLQADFGALWKYEVSQQQICAMEIRSKNFRKKSKGILHFSFKRASQK